MAAEPHHLGYPLTPAEHADFTPATEAPLMSQPALSQQIRRPEHTTQAQPLDRSGHSVLPTDTGASHARHALRDLTAANAPPARPPRRQSTSGRRNAPPNHPSWIFRSAGATLLLVARGNQKLRPGT
ncbi:MULTISPECIES: LysR family transcriptional regulator [Streptomyces]|uniref:LysR family transcriptional regulator n=2 Tax=Streptomyces TaxID=1883 RepID=A0A4Q9I1W1_STRKA|nr:LysR family transcriptional regulator [Streptomyces sp. SID7805]TBO61612.1 LysR family transcriptional regulator [Streptomyces kasugaensis]